METAAATLVARFTTILHHALHVDISNHTTPDINYRWVVYFDK